MSDKIAIQRIFAAELLLDFYKRSHEEAGIRAREMRQAAARLRKSQRQAYLAITTRQALLAQIRKQRGYES